MRGPTSKQLAEFTLVTMHNRSEQTDAHIRDMGMHPEHGSLGFLKEMCRLSLSLRDAWTPGFSAAVDAELKRQNLPSVNAVSAWLRGSHRRILKRGKIRNDEEYQFVHGMLAGDDVLFDEQERDALAKLESEYENRVRAISAGIGGSPI